MRWLSAIPPCSRTSLSWTTPKVIRRLFFDIETSPNIGFFWSPGWKVNLTYENIIHERAIICICYKWAGAKTISSLRCDTRQNDKAMLKKFLPIMNQADEVVAHNGDRFDITWLRTSCLFHKIPMVPDYISIDTLKLARGRFRFNSNRLDYISKYLGLEGKARAPFDLWRRIVLEKDPASMNRLVRYCKRDVALLEQVWDRINTYVPPRSSAAEYASQCPECGSEHTIVNKRRRTAAGYIRISFLCNSCGKYHSLAASRYDKAKAHGEAA